MFFRKKPVVIEAIQWVGDNLYEVVSFISGAPDLKSQKAMESWEMYARIVEAEGFKVETLEGLMLAQVNDWVIKGVKGEFYPCKPDIFALTYDAA